MPIGAVTAAVGAYGAYQQKKAGDKAAGAIRGGNDAATAEQARQFDVTQQNLQPYMQTGQTALQGINRLLAGDYSGALTSPDYLVARDEGLRGLDRALSASGGLTPGTAGDADRIQFASNLGTAQLGNYRDWLSGVASGGQTTATNLGQFGQTYANNVGDLARSSANARASSFMNRGDVNSQLAGVVGGAANRWLQGGGGFSFGPGVI